MALEKSHAHAHAAHEKGRERDVCLCYSVSRLEMRARPQATIRQSGKYHSILGGASCKRDFCILLCSLRELKMQRIRCNFKRS